MRGYDRKQVTLSHDAAQPVVIHVEVDITGDGDWQPYRTFNVKKGEKAEHLFPNGFSAYWVRVKSGSPCRATAHFSYE
jgi:hypothetical protein